VHPFNVALFERIAHFVGLDVAGIDIVAPTVSTPLADNGGGIVEVNAAPGLRMHLAPSYGTPRNVAEPIIDMLFPKGTDARIPLLAVTGTNGKTTTTRLLAHLIRITGKMVGYTTSNGVYVGNYLVCSGDTTGPVSAQMILKDPTVEVAVLETARGGLVRSGLAFDRCDIGVVTNITLDHLGQKDIETLDQMTRVKSIVPRCVRSGGYAVLNADDDRVYPMKDEVKSNIALFSLRSDNDRIAEHTKYGGIACIISDEWVVIKKGTWSLPVLKVIDIPITYSGRAVFMIQNVLAATLAAYCHGITIENIRDGLSTFEPSLSQSPGRLNIIDLGKFSVLIDFAHNAAGLEAMEKFLVAYPAKRKVVVSGGVGDRRNEDIMEVGSIIGRTFDAAIVRENRDTRGRAWGETAEIFIQGLQSSKPGIPVERVLESDKAIQHALEHAQPGDLIAILGGDIEEAIRIVQQFRDTRKSV
jgi:cyanophycin synthetase